MPTVQSTLWTIAPHTRIKHEILRRYLQAWFPILGKTSGRIVYVDGFAGPGEYQNGEKGSPIIALETALHHKLKPDAEMVFIFIEEKPDRAEHLTDLLKDYSKILPPNFKCQVIKGTFADTLAQVLRSIEQRGKALAPTFAFIDPFGFSGIPMRLIRQLMSYQKCEVLITFGVDSIVRWGQNSAFASHLNELFGTDAWMNAFTPPFAQRRDLYLHHLYCENLKSIAGIAHVLSFEMRNIHDRRSYFLCFGTNHPSGVRAMKAAMWAVDPSGTYSFSDHTFDPYQPFLIRPEPDWADLRRRLLTRFKGKTVCIEELENFVLLETPYRETHVRPVLQKMEKQAEIQVEMNPSCGKKRRHGTYPKSITQIRFSV